MRQRVRRQRLLGRIRAPDEEWLIQRLNEIEAYIINMDEMGEDNG